MSNWKTTTAAILTALVTLAGVAIKWLTAGEIDGQTTVTGVTGLLVAFGLWKAADAK